MGKTAYTKHLTEQDMTVTDHQLLTITTEWTTFAIYQCPAQQVIAPGSGNRNQEESMGRVYVFMRTGEATPVEITGKWRIILTDYNETKIITIAEFDGELTHGSLTDKGLMLPLPEHRARVGEDSYIKLQFKPRAAHATAGAGNDNIGWADTTESLVKIPVTIYQ